MTNKRSTRTIEAYAKAVQAALELLSNCLLLHEALTYRCCQEIELQQLPAHIELFPPSPVTPSPTMQQQGVTLRCTPSPAHCHSPLTGNVRSQPCDEPTPCTEASFQRASKHRRRICNQGLRPPPEDQPVPNRTRSYAPEPNYRHPDADGLVEVDKRKNCPKADASHFESPNIFCVLRTRALKGTTANSDSTSELRTWKHPRGFGKRKGTPFCRSAASIAQAVNQVGPISPPSAAWEPMLRHNVPLLEHRGSPVDPSVDHASDTLPALESSLSSLSTTGTHSPAPAAVPEEPPLQDTDSTPASSTASNNLPTLESASTSSSSTSEVRGKFWDDASSCFTPRGETSEVAPVDYWCSASQKKIAKDLAWLEQPEDRPSSLVSELCTQTLGSSAAIAGIQLASAEGVFHPAALNSKRYTIYTLAEAYVSDYHFL